MGGAPVPWKPVKQLQAAHVLGEPLDGRDRWFPLDEPCPIDRIGEMGWNALADLLFPVLVLKERALRHNLDVMARFCRRHGVDIAPHGKTTMSPQLLRRQLQSGAWGVTAATPAQARLFRAFGVERILIANQVVDPAGLRWLASELDGNPGTTLFCLVDSVRGVELMEAGLAAAGLRSRLPVLVELGVQAGRTGARTADGARAVAAAVARSQRLRLAGVECFEGVLREPGEAVDGLLREVRRLTERLASAGAFAGAEEVLVTAGGSAFFDRVVHHLAGPWDLGLPVRVVLRSGCYLTHDHGDYERLSPLGGRLPEWDPLQPALEVWGLVHSRPEPALAILGFGKRDVSYDVALPRPLWVRRRDESTRPAAGMEVFRLNDQHAYLRLPVTDELAVGDMLGCGLAHPCTVFDKWRSIPLVGDAYEVTGAIRTFF